MAVFEYIFEEDTELTGYFKLHANIECRGYDNMDMFLWLKKYKANGEFVPVSCMKEPYRGAWGYFRGARRELDPQWSSDFQPVQAHRKDESMEPGVIYPVEIEIWPTSRFWHKGEKLRLEITGHFVKSDLPKNRVALVARYEVVHNPLLMYRTPEVFALTRSDVSDWGVWVGAEAITFFHPYDTVTPSFLLIFPLNQKKRRLGTFIPSRLFFPFVFYQPLWSV